MLVILVCDTQIPDLEGWGNFGTQTRRLLEQANYLGDISEYVICDKQYDAVYAHLDSRQDIDAIVLTGSRSDSFGDDEWIEALVQFINPYCGKIPLIGICFGHQIIGRMMGLKSIRNPLGWELGRPNFKRNEELDPSIFESLPSTISMTEFHQDVVQLPDDPEIQIIGSTTLCSNQGMYHSSKMIFTVQGHPEFTDDFSRSLLLIMVHEGKISHDKYIKALKLFSKTTNHGEIIGQAMARFLARHKPTTFRASLN